MFLNHEAIKPLVISLASFIKPGILIVAWGQGALDDKWLVKYVNTQTQAWPAPPSPPPPQEQEQNTQALFPRDTDFLHSTHSKENFIILYTAWAPAQYQKWPFSLLS